MLKVSEEVEASEEVEVEVSEAVDTEAVEEDSEEDSEAVVAVEAVVLEEVNTKR
jgi:hypothetical protein